MAVALLAACGTDGRGPAVTGGASGLPGAGADDGQDDADAEGTDEWGKGDDDDAPGDADGADDDDAGNKFDVGGQDSNACVGEAAGVICDGSTAVLCDGSGGVEDTTECGVDPCVGGTGCVACLAGQSACFGPRVMSCNATGDPFWGEVAVCNMGANEACDVATGSCMPLAPIGDDTPTGVYYQYAVLEPGQDGFFLNVSDVGSYGNRVYFTAMAGAGAHIGVYEVELLDSDGDGVLEPNQHPDNPDEPGEIEQREFTFIESFPGNVVPHASAIYATADKLYHSSISGIVEVDLATKAATTIAPPPSFGGMSFLGYDELRGVWYTGNEGGRRVMQYDAETQQWGWAFQYPTLAGDHMDGLEVVVDPETQIAYLYVSDMTSNYLGQYRLDPDLGWVQENLFSYNETNAALVEGFGYGALGHFWVGSWSTIIYELGGGDLTDFIGEPEG